MQRRRPGTSGRRLVRHEPGHRQVCDLPDNTKVVAWMQESKFMVEAFGTGTSVTEVAEQFAWLGAALRSFQIDLTVAYCTPFISDIRILDPTHPESKMQYLADFLCKINVDAHEVEERPENSKGQCWHNLFKNPVIVKGYPIPRRCEPDTGLEILLNIMAMLA